MKSNSIKGLIIKDLLNLSHYKTSLIVIVIIFIGIGISNKDTLNYLPIMLMAMIGMIGLSTFSYDELSKADKYLLTFPTNKKELIKSKYILIISMVLIGAIISILIKLLIHYIMYKEIVNFDAIISILMGGIFGISLIECIQIPSVYKWGPEKGRIQMFILIIVITGLIGAGIYLLTNAGLNIQIDSNKIIQIIKTFGIYIVAILTVIMYFVSYKLSCKIYMKKEI